MHLFLKSYFLSFYYLIGSLNLASERIDDWIANPRQVSSNKTGKDGESFETCGQQIKFEEN